MGNRPQGIIGKIEEDYDDFCESYYDSYDCGIHLKANFIISCDQ
jgi:hypothetical protein